MIQADRPDVTVAVMSYNNARYIGDTIESVLSQTGVSLELIVFDDQSSDDTLAVLESFRGRPGYRYEINEANLGMTGNYNRCVESGSGGYVVVLGSDDIIYPGHLSSLFAAMELHPESPLGYTQCNWIDEQGNLVRYAEHPGHYPHSYFGGRDEVIDLLSFDNYITPSAVMLRRSMFDKVRLPGGELHRPDLVAGDWELWTRIARVAPDFVFLHQPSVGYRIHGGQVSKSFYDSDRPLAEHTEIVELNLADAATQDRMRASAQRVWMLYLQRFAAYSDEIRHKYLDRAAAIQLALFGEPTPTADARATLKGHACFFSVVLTTTGQHDSLRRVFDSLAAQTWRDFEVVLINDHGQPAEAFVSRLGLPTTYANLGWDSGGEAARELGRRLARGQHIVFLEDSSVYRADHLAVLARQLAA
jgi:O-antigen biosynthesis protein